MENFETNPNFVPIYSFYLLSDEEALRSDLAKRIFVWGKVQERYEGEDGIEHYKWNTIYVEVEVVQGQPYGKCKALTMGAEVLEKYYSKLKQDMRNIKLLASIVAVLAMIVSCGKSEPDAPEDEGETTKLKGVSMTLNKVTATKALFEGSIKEMTPDLIVGLYWDYYPIEHINNTNIVSTFDFIDKRYALGISDLPSNKTIYYMPYVHRNGMIEYGDCMSFKTTAVTMTVDKVEVVGFIAVFTGIADLDGKGGILCSTNSDISLGKYMMDISPSPQDMEGTYEYQLKDLESSTTYYYRTYYWDRSTDKYVYGDVKNFTTGGPILTVDNVSISSNEATFTGDVVLDCMGGILYSTDSDFSNVESCGNIDLSYTSEIPYSRTCNLLYNKKYYYCTYYVRNGEQILSDIKSFTIGKDPAVKELSLSSATDLSNNGTANCYIVSKTGLYKIKTVKGNDLSQALTNADSPALLWETFGTDVAPSRMDLISGVCYKDGYLIFKTADIFKEGNAVIAVEDKNGNILWSWHIWFTDQPQGQVYYNNAGTMMDRNLGATSATPGDVGALGLLYQWGRKDPFLGFSNISSNTTAKSTITWPSTVSSNSSNGTIEYATAHPTTFITYNRKNDDWYYTGFSYTDNTRWTTSETTKSIYDPCPSGWRVPDGGSNGVWSKALGLSSYFYDESLYNSTNLGMNFSGKFGADQTIWYPASGSRDGYGGGLYDVGDYGRYWSASPDGNHAYRLRFDFDGYVSPSGDGYHAYGYSVRCLQE